MKNVKLGIIALLAITSGVSAFTAKARASATRFANHAKGSFDYWVITTLPGGTRLITTNALVCNNAGMNTCEAIFDQAYQVDGTTKYVPAAPTEVKVRRDN